MTDVEHIQAGVELIDEFAASWLRCDLLNTPFCHFCGNKGVWTDDEAQVKHNGECIILKAERWLSHVR